MRPIHCRFANPSLWPRLPRAPEKRFSSENQTSSTTATIVRRAFIGEHAPCRRSCATLRSQYNLARGTFSMKCQQCQHENSAKAKFCEECAAPLPRASANCGSQVSLTAKYCPQCGHPLSPVRDDPRFASPKNYTPQHLADKILTSRTALEGERKQVTVLFADIKGSMELLADRDPEDAQKLL